MKCKLLVFLLALLLSLFSISHAETDRDKLNSRSDIEIIYAAGHVGSSPFEPFEATDTTFVVDVDSGLDTGCSFRSDGPLTFSINIDRYIGNMAKLISAGLIDATAQLQMPAYDVDYDYEDPEDPSLMPERDRVYFNGKLLPKEYLDGKNNTWVMNTFEVPLDWIKFPDDPGIGKSVEAKENIIKIEIDVANSSTEAWCTSIDWAALTIKVARPVVMVHGILSEGTTWASRWGNAFADMGLPYSHDLNMGALDSIANNAMKIGVKVNSVKDQWGVDKVNLLCHSKGGLDARHYVEYHNDIEQMIQIGTPNAGSPLADAIQACAINASPGIAVLANLLAGPAGVQLTTYYMRGYNLFHSINPNVKYTALAGDYDPDCFLLNPFCKPIERLLLGITGKGDTIVPISSVHSINGIAPLTYTSIGDNKQATHTQQTSSSMAYNELYSKVSAKAVQPRATAFLSAVSRTATITGELTQGGSHTHQLILDEAVQTSFAVFYPSGDVDLTLKSPSGATYDSITVAGNSQIGYDEGDMIGGKLLIFRFNSPETGIWTAKIDAPLVTDTSGKTAYALNAWLEDPSILFSGDVQTPYLKPGESLILNGELIEKGSPLVDAVVTATVAFPDDTSQIVTLVDNGTGVDTIAGDGNYTGQLPTLALPGIYKTLFLAQRQGIPGKTDFSREDYGIFTVATSTSSFSGSYLDSGRDTDGNALFNYLDIKIGLNITDSATYRISGELTDSSGNSQTMSIESSFAPGLHEVVLPFEGITLFNNAVDGPYHLSSLKLAEISGDDIYPLDIKSDIYSTNAYDYTVFEHPPIRMNSIGSSFCTDTDSNGLFDILTVSIGVDIDVPGYYEWSAHLRDEFGTDLGISSGAGLLNLGFNNLIFEFDGNSIGANGIDGPYYLSDLLLHGEGSSLIVQSAFSTERYSVRGFEGYASVPIPTFSEWGIIIMASFLLLSSFIYLRRRSR